MNSLRENKHANKVAGEADYEKAIRRHHNSVVKHHSDSTMNMIGGEVSSNGN